MGTWWRRLWGMDFPDPAPGQVWRSGHSGRRILVDEVHVADDGTVFVYVAAEVEPGVWGIPDVYAIGLPAWRASLKRERRTLLV